MRPTTRPSEGGQFTRELTRALAQRGRLDPIYQTLSDHWTLTLQRLFPVWCLLGPGLADPGHIELASRTVYLDSDELLGDRREIIAGSLQPRRILVTFGVAIHEVLHAKHTKPWIAKRDTALADSQNADERQLAIDRQLIEEPRMEATGVREFPEAGPRGLFIRRALAAAVVDVIVPRLLQATIAEALSTRAVSRELCGRSMVYLQARTHYGVCDPARLGPLPKLWNEALGAGDVARLDDLFARLTWAKDGDNDALDHFACEYRDIIGPPPPPPPDHRGQNGQDSEQPRDGAMTGPGRATSRREQANGSERAAGSEETTSDEASLSLSDALSQALSDQRKGQLEQLDEDIDLQELLKAATPDPARPPGRGTGRPTGRLPDRRVDRPPFADEVLMARQYTRRLHQARQVGLKRIDKRTPSGRFNTRAHMRAHAQRILRVPVSSHPWEITKIIAPPLQEPHVALVIGTSASMSAYEYALGPIAWVLATGLQEFGGRCAIALFGNGTELLTDGRQPLRLVPSIRTGGGTAFGADAISQCAEQLELDNPRCPRFVYCLSDGGWYDTQRGVAKIRALRDADVPTIHIAIGIPPLSVQADRVVTADDPATAMDLIAADTIEALRTRRHG
ncbi:MAG: hypothetical protein ABSG43_28605 [Solirubrobacteraceae bacterium]